LYCNLLQFLFDERKTIKTWNKSHFQQYNVIVPLGSGRCSRVLAATNLSNNKEVCIKLEPIRDCEQIENEIFVLKQLEGCKGVPNILFEGMTNYCNIHWRSLVTDFVGEKTLKDLTLDKESLKQIAKQSIEILQGIHKQGIIHKDIKPDHLVMSKGKLYFIDFGCAGPRNTLPFLNTLRYSAPLTDLTGIVDEKCDFESLWFSFLTLFNNGCLPWDDKDNLGCIINTKKEYLPQNQKNYDYFGLSKIFSKVISELTSIPFHLDPPKS